MHCTIHTQVHRVWACWPITVRYFARWPLWWLFLSVVVRGEDPCALLEWHVSWYFRSFWTDISQTNFISSCEIIHFVKSDNQFPFISQNNLIAEAPSNPLLILAFKYISSWIQPDTWLYTSKDIWWVLSKFITWSATYLTVKGCNHFFEINLPNFTCIHTPYSLTQMATYLKTKTSHIKTDQDIYNLLFFNL